MTGPGCVELATRRHLRARCKHRAHGQGRLQLFGPAQYRRLSIPPRRRLHALATHTRARAHARTVSRGSPRPTCAGVKWARTLASDKHVQSARQMPPHVSDGDACVCTYVGDDADEFLSTRPVEANGRPSNGPRATRGRTGIPGEAGQRRRRGSRDVGPPHVDGRFVFLKYVLPSRVRRRPETTCNRGTHAAARPVSRTRPDAADETRPARRRRPGHGLTRRRRPPPPWPRACCLATGGRLARLRPSLAKIQSFHSRRLRRRWCIDAPTLTTSLRLSPRLGALADGGKRQPIVPCCLLLAVEDDRLGLRFGAGPCKDGWRAPGSPWERKF